VLKRVINGTHADGWPAMSTNVHHYHFVLPYLQPNISNGQFKRQLKTFLFENYEQEQSGYLYSALLWEAPLRRSGMGRV